MQALGEALVGDWQGQRQAGNRTQLTVSEHVVKAWGVCGRSRHAWCRHAIHSLKEGTNLGLGARWQVFAPNSLNGVPPCPGGAQVAGIEDLCHEATHASPFADDLRSKRTSGMD